VRKITKNNSILSRNGKLSVFLHGKITKKQILQKINDKISIKFETEKLKLKKQHSK